MLRFEIVCTSCEIPRVLAIRHLPNMERFRQFQTSKRVCNFCSFVSFAFHHKILIWPKYSNRFFRPLESEGFFFTMTALQGPSHRSLVFHGFSLKPDRSPKLSRTLMALLTKFLLLLRRVVSSANWLILNSLIKIFISWISLSCLILHAKSSTAKMKRYGDNEHPCLAPLESAK